MSEIDRRSALTLAVAAASTFILPSATHAMSGMSGGTGGAAGTTGTAGTGTTAEGREIAPGVRRIDYSKRDSVVPAYKQVGLRDFVYQPGAKTMNPSMPNDMVCHMLDGELTVHQGPSMDFVFKKGDVWSCVKGMPENGHNTGSTVAVMRVVDLLA
jgi:hypothetical protein